MIRFVFFAIISSFSCFAVENLFDSVEDAGEIHGLSGAGSFHPQSSHNQRNSEQIREVVKLQMKHLNPRRQSSVEADFLKDLYFGKEPLQILGLQDQARFILTGNFAQSELPCRFQIGKKKLFETKMKKSGENRFILDLHAKELTANRTNTLNLDYSVFRTTESQDTMEFSKILSSQKSPQKLPSRRLVFIDEFLRLENLSSQEPPRSKYVSSRDLTADAVEVFIYGGVEWVDLIVDLPGKEVVSFSFPLAKPADWVYYSGHYPYDSGGFLGGESLSPFEISPKWDGNVEVLIFASCYAVDINDPNQVMEGSRRGVNGSAWWNHFHGTLLGYGGSAPSSLVDVAIVRNFLGKLSLSEVLPSNKTQYSQEMAKLWMESNTVDYAANAATAVDSSGNYYYLPKKAVVARGKNFRKPISSWTVQPKEQWEPKNRQMMAKMQILEKVIVVVDQMMEIQGGKPPLLEEVLKHPDFLSGVQKIGMKAESPDLVGTLRGTLEYRAHVFYDVPDLYRTIDAVNYLGKNTSKDRPVSEEQIRSFFTPPVKRPKQRIPDQEMMNVARFEEFLQRLLDSGVSSANELLQKMESSFSLSKEQKKRIRVAFDFHAKK